jgi:hypothetical protein
VSVAAAELRRLVDELADRFEQLDDPSMHDDEEAQRYIRTAGGTFGDALEVEVMAVPLFAAVAALTDLHREATAQLIDAPATAIASAAPRVCKTPFAPLSQYLSIVVVADLDWDAADRMIDSLAPETREARRVDLDEFRRLVLADDYRRFATYGQSVGDHRLFVAAAHGVADFPDVAPGIGRLGRDGVLEAAGVVSWSAPDSGFRGRVHSFVGGMGPRRP